MKNSIMTLLITCLMLVATVGTAFGQSIGGRHFHSKYSKKHLCHSNKYMQRPHAAHPQRDFAHDLSQYQRR